jgi:uncharacterized damage-inducible protein DinB
MAIGEAFPEDYRLGDRMTGKPMQQHFAMMAAYNQWANAVVYEACQDLSEEDLNRSTGAFFGSLIGTLTGKGEAPNRLDTILHPRLPDLRDARQIEDRRIIDWIASLDEEALAGRFTYVTVTDVRTVSQRLAPALAHFFNHQTHHRGQAHATLTGLGRPSPSLDLIYFQRTEHGRQFA